MGRFDCQNTRIFVRRKWHLATHGNLAYHCWCSTVLLMVVTAVMFDCILAFKIYLLWFYFSFNLLVDVDFQILDYPTKRRVRTTILLCASGYAAGNQLVGHRGGAWHQWPYADHNCIKQRSNSLATHYVFCSPLIATDFNIQLSLVELSCDACVHLHQSTPLNSVTNPFEEGYEDFMHCCFLKNNKKNNNGIPKRNSFKNVNNKSRT